MHERSTPIDPVIDSPSYERADPADLENEADRLYETYVRPLEQEHWGEYVIVSPDGRMVRGMSLRDAGAEAAAELGRGNFAFRVGDVVIGTIR